MPPEITLAESKISKEIGQIESAITHAHEYRAYEQKLTELDENFQELYESFNDWNLDVLTLGEVDQKNRRMWLYGQIYNFLAFIEKTLTGKAFDDAMKSCPNFIKTFNHLGKFCHNMEDTYQIKTHVETLLEANPQIRSILKSHLK